MAQRVLAEQLVAAAEPPAAVAEVVPLAGAGAEAQPAALAAEEAVPPAAEVVAAQPVVVAAEVAEPRAAQELAPVLVSRQAPPAVPAAALHALPAADHLLRGGREQYRPVDRPRRAHSAAVPHREPAWLVPPWEEAVVVVVVAAAAAVETAVRCVQLPEAAPARYGLPAFVDQAHRGGAFPAPRQVEPMVRAMAVPHLEPVLVALSAARMARELHREHFRPEVSSAVVCHREGPAPAALLAWLFVLKAAELHRAHSFPPAALLPVAYSSVPQAALRRAFRVGPAAMALHPARFVRTAPVSFAARLSAVPASHSARRAADDFLIGRFLRPRGAAAAALAPPA
ncbi:MAG: hypothetical protein QOJ96_1590 [Alphaproteobacteria bacterium]|nr:hypothetical protein [Alphaproteobacteria bacterium]